MEIQSHIKSCIQFITINICFIIIFLYYLHVSMTTIVQTEGVPLPIRAGTIGYMNPGGLRAQRSAAAGLWGAAACRRAPGSRPQTSGLPCNCSAGLQSGHGHTDTRTHGHTDTHTPWLILREILSVTIALVKINNHNNNRERWKKYTVR